jgi:hypothetical protein
MFLNEIEMRISIFFNKKTHTSYQVFFNTKNKNRVFLLCLCRFLFVKRIHTYVKPSHSFGLEKVKLFYLSACQKYKNLTNKKRLDII